MKRKPGNWLDFNANERETETGMTRRGEKSEEEGEFSLTLSRMTPGGPTEVQHGPL